MSRAGPLADVRVIEIAGIGPAPFCGMLLSDLGADVLRIDRPQASDLGLPLPARFDITGRGRRSLCLDLKHPQAAAAMHGLVRRADILIEGLRPGAMERLGLGPQSLLAVNPALVYGRVTGWGQDGPLARAAGHDLNFIALSGALHAIGPGEAPAIPLNLVGDYGGGALYLALGVLAALHEARRSGQGQVVDAAMVDGAASLMSLFQGLLAAGQWRDARAANLIDGGAPGYAVYETRDGRHVAIGALEPRFFAELMRRVGQDPLAWPDPQNPACWPALRACLRALFLTRTRQEWDELLEGTDACYAPVLSLSEVAHHPHHRARGSYVEVDGVTQPAPAPRLSRTPGAIAGPAPEPGQGGAQALQDWGVDADTQAALLAAGVPGTPPSTTSG